MELSTFSFNAKRGWSEQPFPALDSEHTLLLVFGAPSFGDDPKAMKELLDAYPKSKVLGCSTSGEIFGEGIADESLAVAVLRFASTEIRSVNARVAGPADSFGAGQLLARELHQHDLKAVLVLSDGLHVNGSELVKGLNSVLAESVVVTGGLAGDGARFQKTWVTDRAGPRSNFVVAIGLYGDQVRVGHGSKGGWDLFGPERTITRAEGNVLLELDGMPALELYKKYLGERASGLPATALLFPLALRTSASDKNVVVRTVLSVDEARNSMTFAGDVPTGSLVQLMRANFDRLVEGASEAALHTRRVAPDATSDTLSIAISCVGRRLILGERVEEEIEAVLDELPAGTRQIGFYSYGEISPHATGKCDLHNQTMTLTTIGELG